jgi:hypothetical protein
MDNQCLIFMPSSEPVGYTPGHFGRVYDYVIVPACRVAGVWPEKADNPNSTPEDFLKSLLKSEIAIYDLTTSDPHILYSLAIRQALNLPVVIVKDGKSLLPFYSQEAVEYDDSLRIDTVQKATEAIGAALKNALENKGEKNALLTRLGIDLEKKKAMVENTFVPEPLSEPPPPKEPSLPIISPLPDYVGSPFTETEIEKLKVGGFLFHLNHGKGEIKTLKRVGKDNMAGIQFDSGQKILMLTTSDLFRKVD